MVKEILVKKRNGRLEPLNIEKINRCAQRACDGIDDVSASEVILDAEMQLYGKVPTSEIDKALILSARSKIEKEPNYSYVAARLLLNTIYKEVFGEGVDCDVFEQQYKKSFVTNLKALVKDGRIDPRLLEFDLKFLSNALDISADTTWKYVGIQTVYDRYLLHINGRRMETPQGFWMRVAMGLSINEKDREARALEIYYMLSSNRALSSTPTLFNSGTTHPQLSSCYLSTVEDSIDGIFGTIHGQARLSKFAGGLGVDWTPIRSNASYIKGTNGKSNGVIPFLKCAESQLVGVNQGGKRKGAGCAYLETWHGDIEDFLELRKNTGDERLRTHDMNTANWIPDLFMKRVKEDGDWYLFSPIDVPDLHDLFGAAFEERYSYYSVLAEVGKIPNKKVSAKGLWKKMLTSLFETGHPWITWKDPSNIRYSNQHVGVVHSSNLCTEILLHTKPTIWNQGEVVEVGETAVCNLASINLAKHIVNGALDEKAIGQTVATAIRGLDNVVDLNFYPTQEAKKSNMAHRPVGLGVMGFHDALRLMDVNYDSPEAVAFADYAQEVISYHAILTSSKLAAEKGVYSTYEGSLWSQGLFPIDTYISLMESRGNTVDREGLRAGTAGLDWNSVRAHVSKHGMRNSNTMAIAPTATISYIAGCSQSIEPDFSVLYVYSTLSGENTMASPFFSEEMKKRGLWCPELAQAIKDLDGDIASTNLPDDIKERYKTAFQIGSKRLIESASRRQKWIDQGQSLNLYVDTVSLKALNDMYMYAWEEGLKTTYYLRSKSASSVEKSTSSVKQAEPQAATPETVSAVTPTISPRKEYTVEEKLVCSIESQRRGESCEACQ